MNSHRTLKLRRATEYGISRYYVEVAGQRVGWVTKGRDGTWAAYVSTRSGFRGTNVSDGETRRKYAVLEVLTAVRRAGRVITVNDDCLEVSVAVPRNAVDRAIIEIY